MRDALARGCRIRGGCLRAPRRLLGKASRHLPRVCARHLRPRRDPGTSSETLGVFLVASDPDGIENLSAFYVINDDAELFWKVDRTLWVSSMAEGESWIGSEHAQHAWLTPSVPPGSTASCCRMSAVTRWRTR